MALDVSEIDAGATNLLRPWILRRRVAWMAAAARAEAGAFGVSGRLEKLHERTSRFAARTRRDGSRCPSIAPRRRRCRRRPVRAPSPHRQFGVSGLVRQSDASMTCSACSHYDARPRVPLSVPCDQIVLSGRSATSSLALGPHSARTYADASRSRLGMAAGALRIVLSDRGLMRIAILGSGGVGGYFGGRLAAAGTDVALHRARRAPRGASRQRAPHREPAGRHPRAAGDRHGRSRRRSARWTSCSSRSSCTTPRRRLAAAAAAHRPRHARRAVSERRGQRRRADARRRPRARRGRNGLRRPRSSRSRASSGTRRWAA